MKQKLLFPIFLTHGYSWIKILDEKTFIDVSDDEYDQGVMVKKKAGNVIKSMLQTGEVISEDEFNAELLKAQSHLNQLSFMAVTSEATEAEKLDEEIHINDLENVEI